jgi:hypothetical protein
LFNKTNSRQTFIINISFLCFYPVISKKMVGQKRAKVQIHMATPRAAASHLKSHIRGSKIIGEGAEGRHTI